MPPAWEEPSVKARPNRDARPPPVSSDLFHRSSSCVEGKHRGGRRQLGL